MTTARQISSGARAKRVAAQLNRPVERLESPAGVWMPIVDQGRCEADRECVAVCPYDVFEVRTIEEADYRALPFLSRLKVRVHGMQSAYTPNADACKACGLCVVACPEKAVRLTRRRRAAASGSAGG